MTLDLLYGNMVAATLNKDKTRKLVLSGLVDAVKNASITKTSRVEITESLVNDVIKKEYKTLKEMIKDATDNNRPDLLPKYNERLAIVEEYLPTEVTDPEVIKFMITTSQIELTKSNRGNIMKLLKDNNVNMKIGNEVVSMLLKNAES